MRKIMVYAWLILLCTGVGALFWYHDWKYSLPTPVPKNYAAIPLGSVLHLPEQNTTGFSKPVFLHFFNPDCPCSKFNIEHVRSLIKQYGSSIDFRIVLVTAKKYSEKDIQDRFNLTVPVLHDTSLARICGVYSTPQAVIVDYGQRLYYRGNYNRSRYCADKKTNYAQAALETLLQDRYTSVFDPLAISAYGCQFPGRPE